MDSSPGARHVFLTGFMAVGKSSVGRLVAAARALPFVDLDERIERDAGRSVAEIFAAEGEAGFRARETRALSEVLAGPAAVVATGGGTACSGDALLRMRAAGLVVTLSAPLECTVARAGDPATRPLLQRPPGELRALYRAREPFYRQAHCVVDTGRQSAAEAARQVGELVALAETLPARTLPSAALVALGERAYPVLVAPGLRHELGGLLTALGRRRGITPGGTAGLVVDGHVAPHHAPALREALTGAGFTVQAVVVPAGETSKSMSQYAALCDALIAGGLDRRSPVVALGGGVVGDLAGFAAATLYRGVPVVQVPTTVLAMIDSAIGGKTGINVAAGKNLVGAFWQPALVLADPELLTTLPVRERRAAYGELLKYALLDGEELYQLVAALAPAFAGTAPCDPAGPLAEAIRRSVAIKSWIVSRDEREQLGERALLNLGHTVGHAIETAAGYGTLLHGEAVGLGLLASCRVSARLGLCAAELEVRVRDSLASAHMEVDLQRWLRPDVLAHIGVDKKRSGGEIDFVTLRDVGSPEITRVALDRLTSLLLQ